MGFFKKASDYYIEGIMYYKEKEYAKAYKCFEKGAEDDFEGCIEFLAYYYEHGIYVEQSYAMAFRYYKRITQYNSVASYKVGYFYENGLGIARDEAKAVEYYIRAYNEAITGEESECKPPYEALRRLSARYPEARSAIVWKKF